MPAIDPRPPAWREHSEVVPLYSWDVLVPAEGDRGRRRNPAGVSEDRDRAVAAMCASMRDHGPGCTGVVQLVTLNVAEPAYEPQETVCTAAFDRNDRIRVDGHALKRMTERKRM